MTTNTIIREFTDAELFTMFNIDCGQLVEATNEQVDPELRIEGDELTKLYGVDLWDVRFPRKSKVADPSAMDADELRRCQRAERAERIEQLAAMADNLEQWENDDISITELLPPPKYSTPRMMHEQED